jgi:hypothetical protein
LARRYAALLCCIPGTAPDLERGLAFRQEIEQLVAMEPPAQSDPKLTGLEKKMDTLLTNHKAISCEIKEQLHNSIAPFAITASDAKLAAENSTAASRDAKRAAENSVVARRDAKRAADGTERMVLKVDAIHRKLPAVENLVKVRNERKKRVHKLGVANTGKRTVPTNLIRKTFKELFPPGSKRTAAIAATAARLGIGQRTVERRLKTR